MNKWMMAPGPQATDWPRFAAVTQAVAVDDDDTGVVEAASNYRTEHPPQLSGPLQLWRIRVSAARSRLSIPENQPDFVVMRLMAA